MREEIIIDTLSENSPVQYLELFVNYPSAFLNELSIKIGRGETLSSREVLRIICLYEIDNENILFAWENGFHPITGADWNKGSPRERLSRRDTLLKKNLKAIDYLKELL